MLTPISTVIKDLMKELVLASVKSIVNHAAEERTQVLVDLSLLVKGWSIERIRLYTPQNANICADLWLDLNTGNKILVICSRNKKGALPFSFSADLSAITDLKELKMIARNSVRMLLPTENMKEAEKITEIPAPALPKAA